MFETKRIEEIIEELESKRVGQGHYKIGSLLATKGATGPKARAIGHKKR